jgi:NAD(P)-dependent dehydrogenase (short-subunit alcohol dehydrogenase family)
MISLDGKVAIVTGGASGIGGASSETLARLGAATVIADLDADAAERRVAAIREAGGTAMAVRTDVADEEQVKAVVAAALAEYGRLDILHNNAAAIGLTRRDFGLVEGDEALWEGTFRVNVLGVVSGCRHAIPAMLETGGGAIVNTSSISATYGEDALSAYAASKAAVDQITRSVATQWGKQGIRCNAVAPGLTYSETTVAAVPAAVLDLVVRHASTPYGGQPQDLANAVAFLASDEARYITGQVLNVDGGITSNNPPVYDLRQLA